MNFPGRSWVLIACMTVGLTIASTKSYAQNTGCSCCDATYRQFDFWEGNWAVYDTLGNKVGENTIQKIQDRCVLVENWVSPQMTGTSYNYYDPSDSTWNQLWLDNQGGNLKLKGRYENGVMKLRSALIPGQKIDFYYNQITWRKNPDGTVRQTWEIFDKSDQLLKVVFDGIYRKK